MGFNLFLFKVALKEELLLTNKYSGQLQSNHKTIRHAQTEPVPFISVSGNVATADQLHIMFLSFIFDNSYCITT